MPPQEPKAKGVYAGQQMSKRKARGGEQCSYKEGTCWSALIIKPCSTFILRRAG